MSRYKSVKLQMLTCKHILAQVLTQHQHVLLKQTCCFLLLPLGPQCRAYTVCQCCLSLSVITMRSTPLLPHCRLSVSTCATIFIYKNILAPLYILNNVGFANIIHSVHPEILSAIHSPPPPPFKKKIFSTLFNPAFALCLPLSADPASKLLCHVTEAQIPHGGLDVPRPPSTTLRMSVRDGNGRKLLER